MSAPNKLLIFPTAHSSSLVPTPPPSLHLCATWAQVQHNPTWFVALVWCECLVQLPSFFLFIYAILNQVRPKGRVRGRFTMPYSLQLLLPNRLAPRPAL